MFLLKKRPHRPLLLPKLKTDSGSGSGLSQIFDSGSRSRSGSERKIQNPAWVDSGPLDPVPPLVCARDERTAKFFCPSPVLIRWNWIQSTPDPQNFGKSPVWSGLDSPMQTNVFLFCLMRLKNNWGYFAFSQIWLVESKIVQAVLLPHEAK